VAYFFESIERKKEPLRYSEETSHELSWFGLLLSRFMRTLTQIFIISTALNIFSLVIPLFIMFTYDKVIGAHSPHTLKYFVGGVLVAIAAEAMLRYYRLKNAAWLGARINSIVSNSIFERLLLLPASLIECSSVSSQLSRIKAFEAVRDFFAGPIFLVYLELPFVFITLGVIAIIAGPLAFIPLVAGSLVLCFLIVTRKRQRQYIRRAAKSNSIKQQLSIETFSKLEELHQNGMIDAWFKRYHELSGRASLNGFLSTFSATLLENTAHGISLFSGVATVGFGAYLLLEGQISVGAMIATTILVWRILSPLQTICSMLPRTEQVIRSVDQVDRLMNIKPEHENYAKPATFNDFVGKVEFSRVGVRYTNETNPVFTGLTFKVNSGELIAITGSNGVGKTSVLKLINGLYRPISGTIRIDGTDIRQLDVIELRRHIAYVPQNPEFFTGTIAQNLRLAEPMATDNAIQKVLEEVDAWRDIDAMPHGIDTVIGHGDEFHLSGNLRYRLSLARGYLKKSHIFLFDELPNALLDSKCGQRHKDFLKASKGVRTVFMITHRQDYLQMADKVIILRDDAAPLLGTPKSVIKKVSRVG
jgi:ABC-type bacteriocin/lantibiotic exporter with double-glycine peptidase domain